MALKVTPTSPQPPASQYSCLFFPLHLPFQPGISSCLFLLEANLPPQPSGQTSQSCSLSFLLRNQLLYTQTLQ